MAGRPPGRSGAIALAGAVCVLTAVALAALTLPFVAGQPQGTARLAGVTVKVAIADTDARRAYGLQGRTSLPDGAGMVFVYSTPRPVVFARRSVPFALDVVFVAPDRRVSAVLPVDAAHETAASPGTVGWVVELPAGFAARSGITTGSAFTPPVR